jgi:predicted Zn-dependent protease with MMP-like domain
MDTKDYSPNYKKVVIQVSGYENDSTTDQTIDFPMAFSTSAAISGNNTGLTVSASTSGITITAPDSTTTYNGVIIVEGW